MDGGAGGEEGVRREQGPGLAECGSRTEGRPGWGRPCAAGVSLETDGSDVQSREKETLG